MCFFHQDNEHQHTAAATSVLQGIQELLWPARTPDLLPIEYIWGMMKQELTLSREPATTIAKLRQWVQDSWDDLSQDDNRHLYDRLHVRIHARVAAREG